ncbi:Stress response protein nst1 [Picochlorum sp. SENEW3]|nr:Stress response protein nst1 [Picochlorum sp. SENEW3]WPT15583.1 Stress response protein nst1 [Picochlorum sp. SENEW3]
MIRMLCLLACFPWTSFIPVGGIDNWAARQTIDSTHKTKSKNLLHQAVTEVKLIDIEQEKLNAAIKQRTRTSASTRLLQNVKQKVPEMQQDPQERGSREKEEEKEERKQKEEEERKQKEEEERKQKEEEERKQKEEEERKQKEEEERKQKEEEERKQKEEEERKQKEEEERKQKEEEERKQKEEEERKQKEEEERKQKEEEERKQKEEEERKQKEEQNDLQGLLEKKIIPELKQRCNAFPSWTEAQVERCLNFAEDGIEYDPNIFDIVDEDDILSGVRGMEYSIQEGQNIAAITIKIVIPVTLMAAYLRHIQWFRKSRVWSSFVLRARSFVYDGKHRHVG